MSEGESLHLGAWLRENRERILQAWLGAARAGPRGRPVDRARLLNHLPQLLDLIAQSEEALQSHAGPVDMEELGTVHALERLDEGYDLRDVAAEYGLMREVILELLGPELARLAHGELVLLNQAIDAAVSRAVERYAHARTRTLEALDRISTAALSAPDVGALLERLLGVMRETTEAVDSASIYLLEGERLVVRAAVGAAHAGALGRSVAVGECFAGRVAAARQPLYASDAARDAGITSDTIHPEKTRALFGLPLLLDEQLVGVALMGSGSTFGFSEQDRVLFRTMATRATALIAQAQLVAREQAARADAEAARAVADAVIDAAPVAFGLVDAELRYVRLNAALAELNGRSVAAHLGRSVEEVLPHVPGLAPRLREVLRTGEPWTNVELTGERPARPGERRHYLGNYYPVRGPAGRILGIAGLVFDVTDARRSEVELRATLDFRDQLVGILGHDLRGPLTAIKSMTGLLLRRSHLAEGPAKAVRRIDLAADRMTAMVRDLLDFTHARFKGTIPVDPRPCDLGEIAREVAGEFELEGAPQPLVVRTEGDTRGAWDADRIAQLVSNLLANAVRHGAAGGPVEVWVRGEPAQVVLEVKNGGAPIPLEVQRTIFEPFRQGQQAPDPQRRRVGLGLGLFIVREIARAHGGEVSVASGEQGTRFIVRLPRDAAAPVSR